MTKLGEHGDLHSKAHRGGEHFVDSSRNIYTCYQMRQGQESLEVLVAVFAC